MGFIRDRRFGTRLPMRLAVTAQLGRTSASMYTSDVGPEGLFLAMTKPPEPHHLVHLTMTLPKKNEKVRLRGFVVRTVPQVEAVIRGLVPGVGVQFYGVNEATLRKWFQFIEDTHRELVRTYETYTPIPRAAAKDTEELDLPELENPASDLGPLTPPPGHVWTPLPSGLLTPLPEHVNSPVSRSFIKPTTSDLRLNVTRMLESSRRLATTPPFLYRITPANLEEMTRFLEEALMQEGIVIKNHVHDVSKKLAVVSVTHPTTKAEFHVPGRIVTGSAFPGSTVILFIGVSKRTVQECKYFIENGAPPPFEERMKAVIEEKVIYEDAHETQGDLRKESPWYEIVHEFSSVTAIHEKRA